MRLRFRSVSIGLGCFALTALVSADTLILRDGRRVQGELISVRGDVIEFEERRGSRGGDRIRIDRADVRAIELDDDEPLDRGRSEFGGSNVRPRGLREREVSVDSWLGWKDTGVDVRDGQTVYFSAAGRVRWGPGRQDGPAGENNSPNNPQRPIPGRPAAALIGRVGEGDSAFFIGAETGPIRVRSSGRLFLGVNDDFIGDNTGSFRVTVFY